MEQEFSNLNEQDELKTENEFLKMKIMLEQGGHFGGPENSELPPEIENQFLNNIVAFEQHIANAKTIKVYDKIGRPTQFRPVNVIPESEIEEAWKDLYEFMCERGIDLAACSPNINARELYRFTTEELFEHETDDMDLE